MLIFLKRRKIEYGEGKVFTVYTDAGKLKSEMMRIAPEDEKVISDFINDIEAFGKMRLPIDKAQELFNIFDIVKLIPSGLPLFNAQPTHCL